MKPSAAMVLRYLLHNRGRAVPAVELVNLPCIDYRSRISELRQLGYIINSVPIKGRKYRAYQLAEEPYAPK